MSQKSIEAYLEQLNSGKLKKDEQRVYQYLKDFPKSTIRTMQYFLNMLMQTVSARVSQLYFNGFLKIHSELKSEKNNFSRYIVVTYIDEIKKLRQLIKKERFVKWLKKADEFQEFLELPTLLDLKELQK